MKTERMKLGPNRLAERAARFSSSARQRHPVEPVAYFQNRDHADIAETKPSARFWNSSTAK
jgi:hypothetical protein